jgi:uncharacterized protein
MWAMKQIKKRIEKMYYQSGKYLLCGILSKSAIQPVAGNIILAHGIINDKDEDGTFIELAESLTKKGFNVFRFDFQGHGDSEGQSEHVTITGELRDLENSIHQFRKEVGGFKSLYILGASFGAVSSILYTARNPKQVKKLILWNPVLDFEKTFLKAITPWGKTFFNKHGYIELEKCGYIKVPETEFCLGKELIHEMSQYKPYELLNKLKMPVLTIHGNKDTAVPFSVSKQYGVPNSKSKFISHDCEHSFVGFERLVIDETVQWVSQDAGKKNK